MVVWCAAAVPSFCCRRGRLLANETLVAAEPSNGTLVNVSLTLDMLEVPDAINGYPFLRVSSDANESSTPQGRKLLQSGMLNSRLGAHS